MTFTPITWAAGYCAVAASQVSVMVPTVPHRSVGGVRPPFGSLILPPSGPPLPD